MVITRQATDAPEQLPSLQPLSLLPLLCLQVLKDASSHPMELDAHVHSALEKGLLVTSPIAVSSTGLISNVSQGMECSFSPRTRSHWRSEKVASLKELLSFLSLLCSDSGTPHE